jgi:hypothetical protein
MLCIGHIHAIREVKPIAATLAIAARASNAQIHQLSVVSMASWR